MTVKERLRELVERLPEELPETAIDATETALGPYLGAPTPPSGGTTILVNGVPWMPPTPEMIKERRAGVRAGRGSMKDLGISSEDYYRRKSEEIDIEDEQSARRMSGQG